MAELMDGSGSSGGGSTTNICTINPSDNVAVLNNILSRINDIEKFLSQLVGADVHADNLSELAANIGNILNGTITLPSDGNSPYGTGGSIPVPDGFSGTVISGNVITTWENGVVSFQVLPGSGVTTGVSGGGITNYIYVYLTSKTYAASDVQIDWTGVLDQLGTALSWSAGTPDRVTFVEAGWYEVECSMYSVLIGGARTNIVHGIHLLGFDSGGVGFDVDAGDEKIVTKSASSFTVYWNCKLMRYFDAGDYLKLNASFFTTDTIRCHLSATKLV